MHYSAWGCHCIFEALRSVSGLSSGLRWHVCGHRGPNPPSVSWWCQWRPVEKPTLYCTVLWGWPEGNNTVEREERECLAEMDGWSSEREWNRRTHFMLYFSGIYATWDLNTLCTSLAFASLFCYYTQLHSAMHFRHATPPWNKNTVYITQVSYGFSTHSALQLKI